MEKVNLAEKLALIHEYYKPKIVAELNDSYVKLAKLKGEFLWHRHETEDELFLVLEGTLLVKFRDGEVSVKPGELIVIPRGVEHFPVAAEEVRLIWLSPKSTVNTGNIQSERTAALEWI
jgi:mannose-6-phosphate isomerase-like protein (cupin superfamily)